MKYGNGDYGIEKRFSLRCFLLMPILVVLGCSSAPDILPVGSPDLAKRDWVRRIVAYSDFPVLVTKSPGENEKDLQIAVTWRGKWIWFEHMPFSAATKAQFVLYKPGGDKLCSVDIKNTGEPTNFENCTFMNGKVIDHASLPLVGELKYWFGNNQEPEDEPIVMRTYYVIAQPTPSDPPPQPPAAP